MSRRAGSLSLLLIAICALPLAGTGCGRYYEKPAQGRNVATWGTSEYDSIDAIAVDCGSDHGYPAGVSPPISDLFQRGLVSTISIYCAGETNTMLTSKALLFKYDSSGALHWVRSWGGDKHNYSNGIAVDSGGNIYCGGTTNSFGPGDFDALLLKYNSSGTLQWARTWGGAGWDEINGVAIDSSGNIYCAGNTESFGAGYEDALLLKYDASGTLLWAKTWGGIGGEHILGVAVDSAGNIYCVGYTGTYALLLKYDASGVLKWAKTWHGTAGDDLSGVAVDSGGNIYCAGYTDSFGAGDFDALLLKYDASGALLWARTWGGTAGDYLSGVAVNSGGNIYCVGDTTSFGAWDWDALLLKYDSSGTLQQAKTWGGTSGDYLNAVAVDPSGNIYLGGLTYSYTGEWQIITAGTEGAPSGTEITPPGTEGIPIGTEGSPTGTEDNPVGSETGAGESDALLLKRSQ